MADDAEFIKGLSDFGLSTREARLYYHLLKYGAEPPTVIARHMRTYREDVHRTLNALIDKGLTAKSTSTPAVYVAVPLTTALDTLVQRQKLQQHTRVTLKRELVELAESITRDGDASASIEGCSYRVLRGPDEAKTVSAQLSSEVTSDVSSIMPGAILSVWHTTGLLDEAPAVARRGVRARVVTDISHTNLESARYALQQGLELRHVEPPHGTQFTVHDSRKSLVLIRLDPSRAPVRDASATFFLCESPTYARQLMYHFELVWRQAVDGAARIEALLKSGGC